MMNLELRYSMVYRRKGSYPFKTAFSKFHKNKALAKISKFTVGSDDFYGSDDPLMNLELRYIGHNPSSLSNTQKLLVGYQQKLGNLSLKSRCALRSMISVGIMPLDDS